MLQYQAEEIIDVLTEIRDELRRANEIQTAVHTPFKVAISGEAEVGQWQPSWPPKFMSY